jgi:hypothetical protein
VQQKTALVNFLATGHKLIIYDSECAPQDYSWLPYPFTTNNPGAQGAQGTLTIVEENTLSSNNPASPFFINAAMLSTQTDAVGDMNVMVTFDPNWFLDMSGTNILGTTGPVHTYASVPAGTDGGLLIYNGLDVDFMNTTTAPDAATPAGNLAKIWLQELQQLFNPSGLPGTNPVIGISLTPATATHNVGDSHAVKAMLTDLLGTPQPSILVAFHIDSGPNSGAPGVCSPHANCTTDANGQVTFTYIGNGGTGTDQIKACFNNPSGQTICSALVTSDWFEAIQPLERTKPFDFVSELNGLVNCNSQFTLGTGQAKIDSRADNGMLLLDLKARSLNGRADGNAGVGIRYTAPRDGTINISADIDVAGFDFLSLLPLPKLGDLGISSIESWTWISSVRIRPRRDDYHETRFAGRIIMPGILPIPGSPIDVFNYNPAASFADSLKVNVTQGDELFICAGVKSKVIATGLFPGISTAKVLYGPGGGGGTPTQVKAIRIKY